MIVSMTNKSVDVTMGRLLPGTHFFENLRKLFDTVEIGTALMNSTIIAVVTTLLTLIISSLAGYGFEIFRSKVTDWVFNILLVSLMIPFAAIMIPLYRMFGNIAHTMPLIGIDTLDRKSTRLNSSHVAISYAVFCFKKKKNKNNQ